MFRMMQKKVGERVGWLHVGSKSEIRGNCANTPKFRWVCQSRRNSDRTTLAVSKQMNRQWIRTIVNQMIDGLMHRCERTVYTVQSRRPRTIQCSVIVIGRLEPPKTWPMVVTEIDWPLDRQKPRVG